MKKYISFVIILLLAICCNLNKGYGQATSAGPGSVNVPATASDYLGWNGTVTKPLEIRTQANYRINFYTDSIFRMTIDTTLGYVGIGGFFNTNPTSYLLDVKGGDINIDTGLTSNGYRLGHSLVLWNKSKLSLAI